MRALRIVTHDPKLKLVRAIAESIAQKNESLSVQFLICLTPQHLHKCGFLLGIEYYSITSEDLSHHLATGRYKQFRHLEFDQRA
jgi:hypothetical protein